MEQNKNLLREKTIEFAIEISDICDDQLLESNTDNFDITNTDSEVNNTEDESNIEISEEDKTEKLDFNISGITLSTKLFP